MIVPGSTVALYREVISVASSRAHDLQVLPDICYVNLDLTDSKDSP